MDELTPALVAALAGLAIVDSVSLGTLGMPVWMLAQPRVRTRAVVVYLATIAAFYWAVGVALLAGLQAVIEGFADVESRVLDWVQLVVGVGLFAASFLFDGAIARRRRERRERSGRVSRWQRARQRIVGEDASPRVAAGVAIGAGVVELATMLPYLGAIGLLTANGVGLAAGSLVLVGYALVMVLPASVLLVARLALARQVEPTLQGMNGWFERRGGDVLAWTLGIVGFLVATDAVGRLQAGS
ncbi:MAG: GAP family protein [Cellulomonas sp.]|uniref:Sap-like sulfolipid-1-addressing protein n=1 Tax=Cellulomonas gelida TaxID=1712 RepID=A0A4Y3KS49_9CELL|nr:MULTISPECIES: GAP family protein [Cellulomonas]KMM46007.1 hypothetical protein CWIS_07505 [Cellulomonas sp. A375-1]MCR6649007.1 GAP family protein [Cellulomonas sp.]MCR6704995.1 GAP family protein [Cellulomonas sp.]GEA85760.1 hypothetical protein CGE01nite_30110 [Cellulomonas gelida]GGL39144.1 hypothetical protein GCM10009774_32380 [Cellulomonas gelida]